jgi:4-amino-4-deoxy-L-arabinose transferase-like glycosyltransferase
MMSTDKQAVEDAPEAPAADGEEERQPSWWHRDHPTFAALSGFFTGLLFVALVPAIYVGILSLLFDNDRVEELFPFVLVTLVVPLGLVVSPRTRRFGTYFWIGMVLTAIVVVGVGTLVLWYLVEHQG